MASMATDTVQQIKDRLSIVDVVSGYVKLDRAGSSLRARCPFHAERTPSFHVSPERGTYHCFGCGVGGDIFSFVESIEGLDFKGALKVLAEKAGVEIVYSRGQGGKDDKDDRERLFELMEAATIFYTSRLDAAAKKYLKERGLKEETIQAFRIGWAGDAWTETVDYLKQKSAGGGSSSGGKFTDKELLDSGIAAKGERGLRDKFRNRIMFPIADSAGRVIAFSGRTFGEKASPEAPKYLNSPETPLFHKSRVLYGFDRAKMAIRKHNFAVLVEGQMDLLASHQAGWANTVAVSGTAFTEEHAKLVKRMSENIVLALDADQAGIKAAGRAAREALRGGLNVKVARLPSGSDPADLIQKEGVDAWRSAIRDSKDIITFLLDVLEEHAKAPDIFRRSVETIVLPFLSDISSPIAREQYVGEISKRLRVSESAVKEALEKLPTVQTPERASAKAPESAKGGEMSERAKQAYAILLWQESLPKPAIDIKKYKTKLADALSEAAMKECEALSVIEKEALRFSAERMHGRIEALEREADAVLSGVLLERMRDELTHVTAAIKSAEETGNDKEVHRLMEAGKLLTARIADLRSSV